MDIEKGTCGYGKNTEEEIEPMGRQTMDEKE